VGSVDSKIYVFGVSNGGGALPQIEMYTVIAITVIVTVAIAAAVYLAVRRKKPEPKTQPYLSQQYIAISPHHSPRPPESACRNF
jgi:hypothetical protein